MGRRATAGLIIVLTLAGLFSPAAALAAVSGEPAPSVLGVPVEFMLFALTLLGVAVLHHRTLTVALTGLAAIVAYEALVSGFPTGHGVAALGAHLAHEWVILANLMLLLVGFEMLSSQFERSNLPDHAPSVLPDGWLGGAALLALVFVLSALLDNIASAVIGGVIARHVYNGRVSVGFLAGIVGAANAGGAGSVIGDTTTTIMWLHGVSPLTVLPAYLAGVPAFLILAFFAARGQERHEPIARQDAPDHAIDWIRVGVVATLLVAVVATNIAVNAFTEGEEMLPYLGLALWAAILATSLVRRPHWAAALPASKGALFLVSLVAAASLMPVGSLPTPSWASTLGLGAVSALFDNIPLTALALEQGGYDWALLAYAVGFGGSMVWFGSSAGVALTNEYPEGRSVLAWVRQGWFVPVAYVVGFFVMLAVTGWVPSAVDAAG